MLQQLRCRWPLPLVTGVEREIKTTNVFPGMFINKKVIIVNNYLFILINQIYFNSQTNKPNKETGQRINLTLSSRFLQSL